MNKKNLEILKKQVGRTVREIREKKKLSQRALGDRCELDNSKISKIEKGKINISLSTLVELAGGLETHPAELLRGEYDWLAQL